MKLKEEDSLIIKETRNGKSVFTNKSFNKGEFIIEFKGKIYTREEYITKVNPYNNHFLQIGENFFQGPSRRPDNYINHSCNPNCGIKYMDNNIFLIAIRDIKKGDEITFDYSTTMAENFWEMDCCCGDNRCRKKIRDFVHLPSTLQKEYISMGIIPEFILKKLQ